MRGAGALRELLLSLGRDFPAARQLGWRLFLRDTRAAYRQSFLGFFWLFLPPLATTGVWIYLSSQEIVKVDVGSVPYPLFVLLGTVLWTAFNGALTGTIGVIGEAAALVSKLNFPHEALLLAAVLKNLLQAGIQSLLLIPAFLVFRLLPDVGIFFYPIGLLALIVLGSALGVILLPIATLYHDIGRGVQLILRFAFFITPVAYPIPGGGLGRLLASVNPVTPLLVTTRSLALGGESPAWLLFALISLTSLLLLAFGIVIYKLAMPRLIERMSS